MAKSEPVLRITRLKVVNWRNFRDAEVGLEARAFFVGPNASGKSNLLDAIRFLRDIVKPIGGGLATAVAQRGGLGRLRTLHQKGPKSDVGIEVDVGSDARPDLWSYRLYFNKAPVKGSKKDIVIVKRETILHNGAHATKLFEFDHANKNIDLFTQTKIEQVVVRADITEFVSFLQSIRYMHIVPQIVRDPNRQTMEEDPFGGDLLQQIGVMPDRSRMRRLKLVSDALKLAVPQFETLEFDRDETGRPHLVAAFRHWRHRASRQREDQFSDGTLRLIGFLWAITNHGGPLLLEEPELSLNDEVVKQLALMIARMQRRSRRQVLMTTHSSALISDEGIGLDEVHTLVPTEDGTKIETASADESIRNEVEAGFSIGDVVIPRTNQSTVRQLSLFDVVT